MVPHRRGSMKPSQFGTLPITIEQIPNTQRSSRSTYIHNPIFCKWGPLFSGVPGLSSLVHSLQSAIYRHDPLLALHCVRTAEYALPFGRAAHLSPEDLRHLICAALLHDIGKLTLPQPLSANNEVNRMGDYVNPDCSPREGAKLLKPWSLLHPAATLISYHHERWDGRGTSFGVRGTFIPIGGRILAICDIFDRLTHAECTPTTYDVFSSLRILRAFSSTRYDPNLVTLFTTLFDTSFGNTLRPTKNSAIFSRISPLRPSSTPPLATKKQFLQQNSTPFRLEADSLSHMTRLIT